MKIIIVAHGEYGNIVPDEVMRADLVAEVEPEEDWLYVHKNKLMGQTGHMHMRIFNKVIRGTYDPRPMK